jgi:hypothetical protein
VSGQHGEEVHDSSFIDRPAWSNAFHASRCRPDSTAPAGAEEALAMQLANPIASLISVPFQFNYGFNSTTTLTSVQWKTATE